MVWSASPKWSIINAVTILGQAVVPLLFLYAVKKIVDSLSIYVGEGGSGALTKEAFPDQLLWSFAVVAGVAILQAMVNAFSRLVTEIQVEVVKDDILTKLHEKAIEVDISYYEKPEFRDTLYRAQSSAHFRPLRILDNLLGLLRSFVSLLAMAGLLVSFHWAIVPMLGLIALPGILLRLYYSSEYYSWELRATADERMASYYNEILNGESYAKDVRLFALGHLFRKRFLKLRSVLRAERIHRICKRSLSDFIAEILTVIGVILAFAYMANSVLTGAITMGSLVMYIAALQRSRTHLTTMMQKGATLFEDNLFLQELFNFFDLEPTVVSPKHPEPVPESKKIVFENVFFTYPTGKAPVLKDISLTIEPGEHIAFVGHNGAGKSTLVKLICRLYDVTHGSITVNNTDLRKLDLQQWRKNLGVLMQDYSRFQLSARDNIWLGNIDMSYQDKRISDAAKLCGAHEVIDSLSEGYDSILGHRFKEGHELSTGQWQKIALARIFARNADILILDEPSSALDPKSEDELLRKFSKISHGRTTILISHRLSAVKSVDTIHMLENGGIVESGSHLELMKKQGAYANLYEIQSHRYQD